MADRCLGSTHVWRWPTKMGDVCVCGKRVFDPDHRAECLNGRTLEEQRDWLKAHPATSA